MAPRSTKKSAPVVTSDDERSDSSIVYVRSGIAPKGKPVSKVIAFGEVTSDDDVEVVEKKRKPSSSSPTKARRLRSASPVEAKPRAHSSDEEEVDITPIGKASAASGRILTRDLVAEPRTPSRSRVDSVEKSPSKRPQRTPRPTEKALYQPDTPTTTLIENDSDVSYRPGRGDPKSRRRASTSAVKKETRKPARDAVAADTPVQLRELTDSEDDLPSVSSVLRRKVAEPKTPERKTSGVKAFAKEPLRNKPVRSCVSDAAAKDEEDVAATSSDGLGSERAAASPSKPLRSRKPGRDSIEWDYEALAAIGGEDSDIADDNGETPRANSSRGPPMNVDSPQQNAEDVCQPTDALTLPSLVDEDLVHPDLLKMYSELLWLNELKRCHFMGFGRALNMYDDFVPIGYDKVLDKVDSVVRKKLKRAMGFVSAPPVFNPVRFPMKDFVRGWDCLALPIQEGPGNAIWVLPGICVGSFLSEGVSFGNESVKQVHIQCFENDWEIYQSNIGTFYDSEVCHVSGRPDALVFSTKKSTFPAAKVGKFDDLPRADTSSLKSTSYSNKKCAAKKAAKPTNVMHPRGPAFRRFEEGIPVYDGRSLPGTMGFKFDAEGWQNYESLPRYPRAEIAHNSLVVVAHTIHGFRGDKVRYNTVLLHALFVIVLGDVALNAPGDASST
ncbi:hypothetical protein VNI00_009944 [Paramarasmius palmivorus]|uniref:Uncharacterized protein n=1 Tax=Paramarasmius palmivorus TaxID=297713 RepID=A0AAW0CMM1_9AGAR